MESQFSKDKFIVLGGRHINEGVSLSFDGDPLNPILASTANMRSNGVPSSNSSFDSKKSFHFQDDSASSIGVLDPHEMSDTSLFNLNGGTSDSLGSWINLDGEQDNSVNLKRCSSDFREIQLCDNVFKNPLERLNAVDVPDCSSISNFSQSNIPSLNPEMGFSKLGQPNRQNMNSDLNPSISSHSNYSQNNINLENSQSKDGSFNSDNSFEFNEEELDIGIQQPEEDVPDGELNETATPVKPQHQHTEIADDFEPLARSSLAGGMSSTFDFLKGMGFNLSKQAPANTSVENQSVDQLHGDIVSKTSTNRLDSKYFEPTSKYMSSMSRDQFDSSNDITQTPVNSTAVPSFQNFSNPFGQHAISGKLSFGEGIHTSAQQQSGVFNVFSNAPPIDFNGLEFQNASILQQDYIEDDDFKTAGDAVEMLALDEANFKKEHELSLAENFDQNGQQTYLADFSMFRTSVMTIPDELDERGKVSIGTYMAERSDKLGSLEQQHSSERPWFGMKVKTPSPQKPFKLVDSMSLTTIEDVTCESGDSTTNTQLQESDSQKSPQKEEIDLSAFIMNDSIDKSVMSSLSKALSNMSSTMNSEDLAKFLLAISNQKPESKQNESNPTLHANQAQANEMPSQRRQSDSSKRFSRIPLPSSHNKTRTVSSQPSLSNTNNDSTLRDQTKTLNSSNHSSSSSYSSKSNASIVQNTVVNQIIEPTNQNQSKLVNYSKLNDKTSDVNQSKHLSLNSGLSGVEQNNNLKTVNQSLPVNQNKAAKATNVALLSSAGEIAKGLSLGKQRIIRQNHDFNNVKSAQENFRSNKKEIIPIKEKIIDRSEEKENKPEMDKWILANEDIVKSPAMKTNLELGEISSLPSSNESLMSKEMLSNLLSSTRLSLLRGSLSRESIEMLHKKLRVKGEETTKVESSPSKEYKKLDESNFDKLKELENGNWADTLKLDEEKFKSSVNEDDLFLKKGQTSGSSMVPLGESSPPSSRLSAAFQQLDPSSSFSEMATIAEGHFDPKYLPDLGVIQEEDVESSMRRQSGRVTAQNEKECKSIGSDSRSQRSSMESNIIKHDLSSISGVDSGPKASSTHSHESEFNPDHPPPNFSRHYPMPMMGQEMAGYGGIYRSYPNQSVMHMHAPPPMSSISMGPPGFANEAQGFNNTVYSTRSHPAFNYPSMMSYRPSITHNTVISQAPRGVDVYYDELVPIVVPNELLFNKTLCSGVPSSVVLPLKNKSTRWLQVEIRIITLSINNQCLTVDLHEYVSVKPKHMVGPHCIETVDVGLTCNKPGQCQLVLEVLSCLISMEGISQAPPRCHASAVNLFATVDAPKIWVYRGPDIPKEGSSLIQGLNFHEVMEGSKKSMPLRILNGGKCGVPVRIILFTSSQDRNNFSLSLNSTDTKQDSGRGSLSLLRTNLAVSDQPLIVWVHFHAASKNNTSSSDPPQKVEGKIEVILDAPFQSPDTRSQVQTSLGTIPVSALVGIAKLHARKSQQLLLFSACKGEKQSKNCPVKNAGNITVEVKFLLSSHQEYFTLTPSTANIPPGSDVEVNVKFCPPLNCQATEKNQPINTHFLMIISPNGPQFEVEIKAEVTEVASSRSSLGSEGSQGVLPSLLTNKTRLRWLGVKIGHSRKQKLALRCGKQSGKVEFSFRSTIKGDNTNCFQIVTEDQGCDELCSRCDMSIIPGQDKSINILFQPSKRKIVEAKLEIKTPIHDLPTTKYTIPLSGYGGTSVVKLEGLDQSSVKLPSLKNDHVPDCYTMNSNSKVQGSAFLLTNTGSRSAFIRILVYSDPTLLIPYHDASCSPSQFILQEQQSKKIFVMTTDQCWIAIWNGDELSRQLMKLALSSQSSASSLISRCVNQATDILKDVAFDGIFDGDGNPEEVLSSVQPHSYDVQTFYNNIKLICVQVKVGKKVDDISSLTSTSSLKQLKPVITDSIEDEIPERDVGFLLAKLRNQSSNLSKDKPTQPQKYTSKDFFLNWDVIPTHVALTPPTVTSYGVPEPTRVKIVNKSLASLVYDVMWPGHYLTITPNRGRVDPESVATLLISANPSLSSATDLLPWCGEAIVMATSGSGEDNKRIIHVQIKNNKQVTPLNPDPKPSLDCDLSLVPSCGRSESKQTTLKVVNTTIDFGNVNLGNNSKSNLEFRNMSKNNTKWILTSFAPPYVKGSENSGKLFRSTYAAFVFSHTSGILEPGARIQVPVTFNPMNPGIYSQHWEIEYHSMNDDAGLNLSRVKILLQGQSQGSQISRKDTRSSLSSRNSNREDIYISDDTFRFPKTSVGKSSVVKIPIKNKGKTAHTIKFVNLRLPFHMFHQKHTIRSMHCVNLPVTFKPTGAGTFNGSLVIQTENSESLMVALVGPAVI